MSFLKKRPANHAQPAGARTDSQPLPSSQPFQEWQFSAIEKQVMPTSPPSAFFTREDDIHRQNVQHYLLRSVIEKNYVALLSPDLRTILDVGCGTGRWAREMALEFPLASVIACDLTDPAEDEELRPSNYTFRQENILQELHFPDASFDFVHQRLMLLSVPSAAWPQIIQELARLVKPGGWLELVEGELGAKPLGPASQCLVDWLVMASRMQGIDSIQSTYLEQQLRNAGLEHIIVKQYPIPVGKWGGKLGITMASHVTASVRLLKPLLVSHARVNPYEFEQVLAIAQQEWEHLYTTTSYYAVCGQKAT